MQLKLKVESNSPFWLIGASKGKTLAGSNTNIPCYFKSMKKQQELAQQIFKNDANVDEVYLLTGVQWDNMPSGAKEEYGFEYAFADYHDALDLGIDVVAICTPNAFHVDAAVDFMKAGAHVICEKPMARNVEECDRMMAAAEKYGKRLFISHSQQFNPAHRKMIDGVKNGTIGKPFMAKAEFIGNEFLRMNDPKNWKGTWEVSGGGVLIDNGVHMINLLVAMFGKAKEVTAMCEKLVVEPANKAEDTAEVIILFESGVMAQVSVTFAARQCAWPAWYCGAAHRVEVMGTEGSVVTQNDLPNYQFVSADGTAEQLNSDQIDIDMSFYFLKCLAENKESIITTEDARHTVAIVEAAYKSSREGRKVALTEIG